MSEQVNVLRFLGIPDEFGYIILLLSFILVLSPYFAGADFGILKVPKLPASMRLIGPLAFLLCLLLFVPALPTQRALQRPQLAGTWTRSTNPPDGMRISIVQTDARITGDATYLPPGTQDTVSQTLSGEYVSSESRFRVQVQQRTPSCSNTLHGWLRLIANDEFVLQFYASTGTCNSLEAPGAEQVWSRNR